MNETIDYTKMRKSKSIRVCPVCDRKGHYSEQKIENKRKGKVYRFISFYSHTGYWEAGSKVIYDNCIVNHLTGEQISVNVPPNFASTHTGLVAPDNSGDVQAVSQVKDSE